MAATKYRRTPSVVTYIQIWWRGAAVVSCYRQDLHAVVVIQAGVRGFIAGARYRRAISAGTHIHASWRGPAAAKRYRQKLGAVVAIQTSVRGAIATAKYRRTISAVTYFRPGGGVQSLYRGTARSFIP